MYLTQDTSKCVSLQSWNWKGYVIVCVAVHLARQEAQFDIILWTVEIKAQSWFIDIGRHCDGVSTKPSFCCICY